MSVAPPAEVRQAFGLTGDPQLVSPSNGGVWLADGVVLQRAPDPTEAAFVAELTHALPMVADAARTVDGSWTHQGWSGTTHVPAHPDPRRWDEVLAIGDALHRALADLDPAWPAALDSRTTPWAVADRVAWQEESVPSIVSGSARDLADRVLADLTHQPPSPRQVVHAELAGNVLFREQGAPIVIDLSPYRRTAAYARGIAVLDQVCWHHAPVTSARSVAPSDLARAIVFRVVAAALQSPSQGSAEAERAQALLEQT